MSVTVEDPLIDGMAISHVLPVHESGQRFRALYPETPRVYGVAVMSDVSRRRWWPLSAALSAAVMFLLMLLFTPVALMIPKEATAPALILIGLNMFSGLRKVDLANFTDGLPVLMMVMMANKMSLDPLPLLPSEARIQTA